MQLQHRQPSQEKDQEMHIQLGDLRESGVQLGDPQESGVQLGDPQESGVGMLI